MSTHSLSSLREDALERDMDIVVSSLLPVSTDTPGRKGCCFSLSLFLPRALEKDAREKWMS